MDDGPRALPTPWWKRAAPFVLAIALLAFLLQRLDLHAFAAQLGRLDYPLYVAFGVGFVFALLAADAFATKFVYRGVAPVRFIDLFVLRGASYLPSILNHHLGQAFITYTLSRMFGISLARAAGSTLLMYATWMGLLLAPFSLAIVLLEKPLWWLGVPAAMVAVYALLLLTRPPIFARRPLLAPLFEAGIRGHLVAVATRLPHFVVLFAGTWLSFWFFEVRIPFANALATVPILIVVTTLPLTPQGIGTRDVLAALFFEGFASGATHPERLAQVAASTSTWIVLITVIDIVLGFAMMHTALPALQRRRAAGR